MDETHIRCFVAVYPDEAVRAELMEEVAYLRSHLPYVRWVAPEQFHLTLHFLGAVRVQDLSPLMEALEHVAAQAEPMSLEVCGVIPFPSITRPKVLVAGCRRGRDEVMRLAREVQAACGACGYAGDEKPFQPHMTLGRVRNAGGMSAYSDILSDAATALFGDVDIERMVLCRSELTSASAIHTALASWMLGNGG